MSRLDDLKKQNPELNISLLDLISEADPSETNKYVAFLVRCLKNRLTSSSPINGVNLKKSILHLLITEEQMNTLYRFEKHCVANRVSNPDITKYNSFNEIDAAVLEADHILKIKEQEKQIIKLYSDDEYLVIIPLSYEAAKSYGGNTKWCVTEKETWGEYWGEYKLIFIINKKRNTKFAVSMEYASPANIQGWDEIDEEISTLFLPFPEHIVDVLKKELSLPKYTTEFNVLGDNVILTPDGVVEINEANTEDISTFLTFFDKGLSDEFKNKLKKKIHDLGGTHSSNDQRTRRQSEKEEWIDVDGETSEIYNTIKKMTKHLTEYYPYDDKSDSVIYGKNDIIKLFSQIKK